MDTTLTAVLADEIATRVAAILGPRLAEELRAVALRAPQADLDERVGIDIAFRLLGVRSASALRRMVERGLCPVVPTKIAGRWKWRRGDLIEFQRGQGAR